MTDEESFLEDNDREAVNDPVDVANSPDEGKSDDVDLEELLEEISKVEGSVERETPSDLEDLAKERDGYLDALRHLQADFENFRKRTVRQQTETLERASLSLIERLLPVLDSLDLAVEHVGDQEDEAAAALTQIAGLARSTLEKEGLERIDETNVAFDPTIHDAVSHVEGDESTDRPTVVEVFRSGYRLKGKVVRPAMVAVKG